MALDYECFMNTIAKKRTGMVLRSMHRLAQNARDTDLITLVPGLPNPAGFPVHKMVLNLKDGSTITLDRNDMISAQQYTATHGMLGYPALLETLVQRLHSPPCWDGPSEKSRTRIMPTSGGTDGYLQVMDTVLERGDSVLVDEYTYPGLIALVNAIGATPVSVEIDEAGTKPESLRSVMSRWDRDTKPGVNGKPKLMYIVPTGHNPTGCMLTLERKREIYGIAQEYNFLIFEDDPYYLLTFGEETVASFLSLDTDGRVLRGDSFSKSIAAGLRAGYISGPEALITKINYNLDATSTGTSALTQKILMSLFSHWGVDGYIRNAKRSSCVYKDKRDVMVRLIEKWLAGYVEYTVPTSGMFVWIKIKGCSDTLKLLKEYGLQRGISAAPGEFFQPISGQKSEHMRLSYSRADAQCIDEALKRLAEAIADYTQNEPQ